MSELAFDQMHKTVYCIPTQLRDEQIKLSLKRIPQHLQPFDGKRKESIAVVCYGSSLRDTWEQIKDFKHIITCSGAHKFLLDKGLSPRGRLWYHIEVDPRPHKISLLGKPKRGVKYLVSSTCHADYLKHLDGMDVRLWHVFDNDNSRRIIPRGEWAITGGSNVGLRAMAVARFLGYYKQEVFGMDGSKGPTGLHAGDHPNQPKKYSVTTYGGKKYKVTPSLLECAKQTPHEMNELRDVEAKFHGEGLVQAIMRNYKRKKSDKAAVLALSQPELITAGYRELNRKFHEQRADYGISGHLYAEDVKRLVKSIGSHSVLDYGCGKGTLAQSLPFPIWEYDPAIPGKDMPPRKADIVVCTDVLEHIEPECIGPVLEDLARVVQKIGYFVIHTGASIKTLPDGRNAHILQQPSDWWADILSKFFKIGMRRDNGPLVTFVVGRK